MRLNSFCTFCAVLVAVCAAFSMAEIAKYVPEFVHDDLIESVDGSHHLGCVDRSTIMTRAKNWVDSHVPYSQTHTYEGYREDCSGYVSMAWELSKPGLTTETLGGVSVSIKKDELKSGDILLCASEHVVIFGGWADSDHSHYIALEETRPGEGTVKRTTPYPYWYNVDCFKPRRYKSIC
eukprot:TRINITY_DN1479_c0_g1_i1.p1 TRINITY_DN1479_c0_g1~~TRINITY_DN1479_c0_g1_i1.p1  ORF type:complete len:179 (-),score=37.26 TRINITY_DN1479_c0_g1_i1:63-599(-)